MTRIELQCATIQLLEPEVLMISYTPNHLVELKDAKELEKAFNRFYTSKKLSVIINLKDRYLNISAEAQKFMARKSSMLTSVKQAAVLVNNLPTRLMVKYYIQSYHPIYQIKIFKEKKMALNWFLSKKTEKDASN